MAASYPRECPTCAAGGRKSAVQVYQLNFEEATVMCENAECLFPLLTPEVCPLVFPHKYVYNPLKLNETAAAIQKNNTHLQPSPVLTSKSANPQTQFIPNSETSKSVISKTQVGSTAVKRPVTHLLSSPVYKPSKVAPNAAKKMYAWPPTPISSAMTSPASSVASSLTDREIELAMEKNGEGSNNSSSFLLDLATPSPSPLGLDDIDSFIAEMLESPSSSFAQTSTLPQTPVPYQKSSNVKRVEKKLPNSLPSSNRATPVRPPEEKKLRNSLPSSNRATPVRPPEKARATPVRKKSPPPPPPVRPPPQISFQVNDQGTTVFTIVPPTTTPTLTTPRPASTNKVAVTSSKLKLEKPPGQKKMASPKVTKTPNNNSKQVKKPKATKKVTSPSMSSTLDIQDLVSQFVQSSRNRAHY